MNDIQILETISQIQDTICSNDQMERENYRFASTEQVTGIVITLSKILGNVDREERVKTLAFLCGYSYPQFGSTNSLSSRNASYLREKFYGKDADARVTPINPVMRETVLYCYQRIQP